MSDTSTGRGLGGLLSMRPRLTPLAIVNMCVGFFGIQIGFGLQNVNTSRIFQTLGAEVDSLAILWIAAPMTGLLIQPLIGHLSDKTWGRLGRRRPYFLFGAILTTIALIAMPNSPSLWFAALMLWVMDASINITMEPFRAFVGDNLNEDQRTTGYAMQSVFIGAGAVFASVLPWVLSHVFAVASVAPEGVVPDSVRIAFYVGAASLLAAVLWTVFTTREYSPEQIAAFDAATAISSPTDAEAPARSVRAYMIGGLIWLAVGGLGFIGVAVSGIEKELYVLFGGLAVFGILQIIVGLIHRAKSSNGLSEILDDIFRMPATMRDLAIVQFFSWFALFAMWIYTTPAVTAVHFGAASPTSAAYGEGADWVGVLMGVYNGVAALAAFLIPVIAKRIGRRGRPRPQSRARRAGPDRHLPDPRSGAAVAADDRRRLRLGLDRLDALRHPFGRGAGAQDGRLYGHLQHLHRRAAAGRRDPSGPDPEVGLRRSGHLGAGHRWRVLLHRRRRRPAGQGSGQGLMRLDRRTLTILPSPPPATTIQ